MTGPDRGTDRLVPTLLLYRGGGWQTRTQAAAGGRERVLAPAQRRRDHGQHCCIWGEGRRRRVTNWRRFLPRELQQALKALNPEWRRPRLGALVEDGNGDDRQMQQCRRHRRPTLTCPPPPLTHRAKARAPGPAPPIPTRSCGASSSPGRTRYGATGTAASL
jgi:hypothetical protein